MDALSSTSQNLNVGDLCLTGNSPTIYLLISEPNSKGFLLGASGESMSSSSDEKWKTIIHPEDLLEGNLEEPIHIDITNVKLIPSTNQTKKIGNLKVHKLEAILRLFAQRNTETFYNSIHKTFQHKHFVPGQSKIKYAGRVFDEEEMINLVDSSLDFWLTSGRYTEKFEKSLSHFLGLRYCSVVNSGSSANLLAFMALTSSKLKDKRIQKGDEVITVSAGFPTTVTPIIQYGAVPVFVDVSLPTYNIDCSKLEEARSQKTKALMVAHTLGNPFDLEKVKEFCDKYNLWLIEDNCDALGSKYNYKSEWKYTGSLGDIGTSSFYPPHHITMGEGGAVYTNHSHLKLILESFRDWGRDCWCPPGHDNTCKKRFGWDLGKLPHGYDHKYTYSHFGYNLKATDMQAAIGCAQLKKLPSFIEARKKNWNLLRTGLSNLSNYFILPEPTPKSDPSWFGFILTVREQAPFTREEIVNYLESCGVQTRMLFAGNLIQHPCFDELRDDKTKYRVIGNLENTNRIMKDSFWIGVYPGTKDEMIQYEIKLIQDFCSKKR